MHISFASSSDPDQPNKLSSADHDCKLFGYRSGPTKCCLLITFANNLDLDQARQNGKCNLLTAFANNLDPDPGC